MPERLQAEALSREMRSDVVNLEGKTHKTSGDHVCASGISHSSRQPKILPDVSVLW